MWLAWGDFAPLRGYNNLSQQGTVLFPKGCTISLSQAYSSDCIL